MYTVCHLIANVLVYYSMNAIWFVILDMKISSKRTHFRQAIPIHCRQFIEPDRNYRSVPSHRRVNMSKVIACLLGWHRVNCITARWRFLFSSIAEHIQYFVCGGFESIFNAHAEVGSCALYFGLYRCTIYYSRINFELPVPISMWYLWNCTIILDRFMSMNGHKKKQCWTELATPPNSAVILWFHAFFIPSCKIQNISLWCVLLAFFGRITTFWHFLEEF